jgi:hypothetical protein
MNEIFYKLTDFEEKMREIALKAATGEYGKVGNKQGMNLDV